MNGGFPNGLFPHIRDRLQSRFSSLAGDFLVHPVGGGSINDCYRLEWNGGKAFCKINSARKFPHLFSLEAGGLEALRNAACIRVPEVYGHGSADAHQFLLLEWIDPGPRTEVFWKRFGRELAVLHTRSNAAFGQMPDNFMGSVTQANSSDTTFARFFAERRLQPMVRRCREYLNATLLRRFEDLYRQLPLIFEDRPPALVHGDLWSGNFLCSHEGDPVLIDPACYYGHPSVDLGMSTLFGGFDPAFYEAYREQAPFAANHRQQREVCNLYPLLIHLHLFGSSYLPPIREILDKAIR